MQDTTLNPRLFPLEPITFVAAGCADCCCPTCGEQRVTDCIYGFITFLCGASRTHLEFDRGRQITICERAKYVRFVEEAEPLNPADVAFYRKLG